METNQAKTASRSKPKRPTSQKATAGTPRVSTAAKRRASNGRSSKPARTATKRAASAGSAPLSEEQRNQRIAVAAYFLAERRGFAPHHELDDWLAAERSL